MDDDAKKDKGQVDEDIHQMRCGICHGHRVELRHNGYGFYYRCADCGATVGCHRGTRKPMGITMDKEGRKLRKECHDLSDGLWTTSKERSEMYRRLASLMGMPPKKCHFSKMNKDQLIRAKEMLERMRPHD